MAWSVIAGVTAALATGFMVGIWAAFVGAPPEAAGGIASLLGGAIGFGAFGSVLAIKMLRRFALMSLLRARFA